MHPYPENFPTKALGLLLDRVRGRDVENSVLAQAIYTVIGYGLYQSFGAADKNVSWGSTGNEEFSLSAEQVLELALANPPEGEAKGGIAFSLVVTVALAILKKYLV